MPPFVPPRGEERIRAVLSPAVQPPPRDRSPRSAPAGPPESRAGTPAPPGAAPGAARRGRGRNAPFPEDARLRAAPRRGNGERSTAARLRTAAAPRPAAAAPPGRAAERTTAPARGRPRRD